MLTTMWLLLCQHFHRHTLSATRTCKSKLQTVDRAPFQNYFSNFVQNIEGGTSQTFHIVHNAPQVHPAQIKLLPHADKSKITHLYIAAQ